MCSEDNLKFAIKAFVLLNSEKSDDWFRNSAGQKDIIIRDIARFITWSRFVMFVKFISYIT